MIEADVRANPAFDGLDDLPTAVPVMGAAGTAEFLDLEASDRRNRAEAHRRGRRSAQGLLDRDHQPVTSHHAGRCGCRAIRGAAPDRHSRRQRRQAARYWCRSGGICSMIGAGLVRLVSRKVPMNFASRSPRSSISGRQGSRSDRLASPRTRPSADAPWATASCASATDPMQQIWMRGIMPVRPCCRC